MHLRRVLAGVCVAAIVGVVVLAVLPSGEAAKATGLSPGPVFLVDGNGELHFDVFNATSKPIEVQFEVRAPYGDWDLTSYSITVAPGARNGPSFYCETGGYCGGVPVISPATVVPSIRYEPDTGGGYVHHAAGDFKPI